MADARLYLGKAEVVLPTLEAGSVDCIVTDPPYGHNNNSDGDLIHRWEAALGKGAVQEARGIANDGAEANDLFRSVLPEFRRVLVAGGCCCSFGGGGGPNPQFARWCLWLEEVFDFQMVIWDKGPMGMGWHYRRSYETILVAQKPGAKCRWFDTSRQIENVIRRIPKIIPSKHQHPTEKPPDLMAHFIRLHTRPGDTVLDPFMGHGGCGVAAVELGRNFVGVELDSKHFAIAERRIREAQTGGPLFEAAKDATLFDAAESP